MKPRLARKTKNPRSASPIKAPANRVPREISPGMHEFMVFILINGLVIQSCNLSVITIRLHS